MIDGKPMTYTEFKAKKKRRERIFVLVTDDDARTAMAVAEDRLDKLKFGARTDEVNAARADYDEAAEAVRESAIVMRLRALPSEGDNSFAVLKAEHPPTAEDNKRLQDSSGDSKAKASWNSKTFPPALVAASLVDPQVSPEEADEMRSDFNNGEWTGLYLAALDVNSSATDTGGLTFS